MTTPTAPTMTIADKHRLVGDLLARPDLGVTYLGLYDPVDGSYAATVVHMRVHGGGTTHAKAASLLAAWDLLDDPRVHVFDPKRYDPPRPDVSVHGSWRGVEVRLYGEFPTPADVDLIRTLGRDRTLLLALAGDSSAPSLAQVRDEVWATLDQPARPTPLESRIREVYRECGLIDAIREYRNSTRTLDGVCSANLAESKAWVERVCVDAAPAVTR